MKYESLYNLTIEQGGATVRIKDYPEKIVMPVRGFAVGNWAEGMTVENDAESFDISIERALPWFVAMEAEYLGTWLNEGIIHIDPVDVFASKDFAMGVAWARGEEAIFDLARKKEIRLK